MFINCKFNLYSKKYCALFFIILFSTAASFAKTGNDTVKFIQITDVHLIFSPDDYHSKFIQGRYNYFWKDEKPFKQFLRTNSFLKKSDFLVITGDIVDFFEAESKNEELLLGTQIEQFQSLIETETNLTVYLTTGNHDITSYPKGRYHQNRAEVARSVLIRNCPSFKNGTYYSKIYKAGNTTYRLIFLDNGYFSGRTSKEQADFIIDRYQLDWLKAELNESADDKEIIFMHMPLPIIKDENKEDNTIISNYDEYTERTNTKNFLDIIKDTENSSVQLFITGHRHINAFSEFDFSNGLEFKQIHTGAFGNDVNNWRFFNLTESEIIFSEPGEFDKTTKLQLR